MEKFNPKDIKLTKYLFFTGKGGVGKTSTACATAVNFADSGKKVLLVSTDPASNLQDVFETELSSHGTPIKGISNLVVANLDPIKSAEEYRESVIAPYRGKMPDVVIKNMEEQLSGSCTIEIAAFNEFSNFLANKELSKKYDYIIFDTAPTGHTLRFLQLPSAWSNFIGQSTHGASCLGQLSGLDSRKEVYKDAMETLSDKTKTTLVLITKPNTTPLIEAERASHELSELGINNQILIVNGILENADDKISTEFKSKQIEALNNVPTTLKKLPTYYLPLRAYNIMGIDNMRGMLDNDKIEDKKISLKNSKLKDLKAVINDLHSSHKRVIFTMGKGGVGKTTIASAIALGLSEKGNKVHLATTDPASHLKFVVDSSLNITFSSIDEKKELKKYQDEVISQAKANGMTGDDLAYIEEDLRSPCTQEIAVFRAFAEIVEKAKDEIVVIDTAPTGHTLLLLDSTQSYHKEVLRTKGIMPESVKNLLPRLMNANETEVVIITLAETTPVYEAMRLAEDLARANIKAKWWIVNNSMLKTNTNNRILKAKASTEAEWINKVDEISNGNFAVVPWTSKEIKGQALKDLIK